MRIKRNYLFSCAVASMLGLSGCGNDSKFSDSGKGNNPTTEEPIRTTPEEMTADAKPTNPKPDNREVVDNGDFSVTEKFTGNVQITKQSDVDIIFAVDTSGSMDTEKSYLEQNMKMFLSTLAAEKGINPQIYLIGSGFDFPIQSPALSIINKAVGSNDALNILKEFFDEKDSLSVKLRANAAKEIIVISDDNASVGANLPIDIGDILGIPNPLPQASLPIDGDEFLTYLKDNKSSLGSNIHMNGFIGMPNSAENDWCSIEQVGSEYLKFDNSEYKGKFFDLCTEDWSQMLDELATQIIDTNVKTEFVLSKKMSANNVDEIKVSINGVEKVRGQDWVYNPKTNAIKFQAKSSPKDGDNVEITYVPEKD